MKFDWIWLIVGIVALTGFAANNPKYGKWFFAIVMLGALLIATDKISGSLEVGK